MRIVFGWYGFKIKSYTPEEVGLPNETKADVTLEVRQRIFHLFWIPFFPIGKTYALRREGKLYEMPPELSQLVMAKGKHKTPWYSFMLPILAVLTGLGYLVNEEVQSQIRFKHAKDRHQEKTAALYANLEHLSENSYINILDLDNRYNTYGLFLKVLDRKDSILNCAVLETGLSEYEALPYAIKNFYELHKDTLSTIGISMGQLRSAVCEDLKIYREYEPFGAALLANETKYIIDEIIYIDGPVIEESGGSMYGSSLRFDQSNFGSPVTLTEIQSVENELEWTVELPLYVGTDSMSYSDRFVLTAENYIQNHDYEFILNFEDELQNIYRYRVKGINLDRTIERILD